jgi:hypothetical protein
MPEPGEPRRRYGDKEVGLILKRAAEIQHQEPTSAAEGAGLSLAELEEIAAEAGIDARYLRRAAVEVDAGSAALYSGTASRFLGAPLAIQLERTLTGNFPEDQFEQLVPDIQHAAEGHGQASALGRTLTWQSSTSRGDELRSLQITVTTGDGRTRVRIEERLGNFAGAVFGGIMGGGGGGVGLGVGLGVGIGALQSAAFAIAWPIGIVGAAYLTARSVYSTMVRRRQRVLRDLLDRLTDRIETVLSSQTLPPGEGPARLPRS